MSRLLLFFLAILVAGCGSPSPSLLMADGSGCSAHVPPPQAGARAEYEARGTAPVTNLQAAIIDWRIVGAPGKSNGVLELPEGSRLAVLAMPGGSQLVASGDTLATWMLQYQARRPQDPAWLPFHQDFLDGDGALVRDEGVNSFLVSANTSFRQSYTNNLDQPVLFGASRLWGQTVDRSFLADASFAGPTPLPGYSVPGSAFRLTTLQTGMVGGACQATVVGHLRSDGSERSFAYVVRDGQPFPTEVHMAEGGDATFVARLIEARDGEGDPFPAYRPATARLPTVPLGARGPAPLAGMEGVFATPWPDVEQALAKDATASGWLRDHPGAQVEHLVHAVGDPQTDIIDRWMVTWDGGDSSLRTDVTSRRPILGLLQREADVVAVLDSATEAPLDQAHRADLSALVERTAGQLGRDVEVLRCSFSSGYCGLGTHAGTGTPYASDDTTGATGIQSGLVWDVATGELLQIDVRGPVLRAAG